MGCCGRRVKPAGATSAEAEAQRQARIAKNAGMDKYQVTYPDGTTEPFKLYIDARRAQKLKGGKIDPLY